MANDRDLDLDILSATVVTGHGVQHGTLTLQTNGSFAYVVTAGYVGTDTFRYRINDGAQTTEADVTITVVNQRPIADNDKYGATVEQLLTVTAAAGVLANDVDPDQDVLQAVLYSSPTHGTLNLNTDGSFTYTPHVGFIGVDEFRYEAKDTLNLKSFIRTVSISTALVATDDDYEVSHDRTLTSDVGSNDHSVSGPAPIYVLVSGPASGNFSLSASGTYSFTPATHFVGLATFTYRFSANGNQSNIATATIDVVNEAPLVFTGTWRESHGQTITASAADGLAFRSRDRDGDAMTFSVVQQPTHGTLTLQTNGSFVYVPIDPAYTGSDSFTWKAFDGLLYSEVKTAWIELLNHKATVTADSYETHSGHTLTVTAANGVLSNDYDGDADSLQAQITVQPTHGTVTLAANGSFVYTPNAGTINANDTFKYRVHDGAELSAEATVSIHVANAIPFASSPKYRMHQSTTLTVAAAQGLLNSAIDADGDSITVQLVNGPTHGTISVSANGSFSFVPTAGWTGTDSFTFSLSDGFQTSAAITAQIEVQNNVADVVDDWFAMRHNQSITISAADLLHNDADPDHDNLSVTISVNPAHGTLTQTSTGVWTYSPTTNYIGTDTFQYVVYDGASTSPAGTVEIEVKNSAPQGGDDRFLMPHDRSFATTTPEIVENDYDADGDTLTVSLVTGVSHGTLTLNSSGTFTYVPATGFVGTDSFEYRTSDGTSQSNISLVTFEVQNNAPRIHEQYHRTKHDQAYSVDASSGLRYYAVDPEADVIIPVILANPAHGTLNVATDGSWTYTPNAGFVGKDSFTWRASDGVQQSDPAIVTIEVTNTDVVTSPDYYTLSSNQTLTVAAPGVLKNDLNLDQDALTLTVVSNVEHGTLALDASGSFTYSPTAGFAGEDQFIYKISDGVSESYGKVTLQVGRSTSGVAQFSVRPDRYRVNALRTLVVTTAAGVVANDSYTRSGAAPTVVLVTGPAHGTLTLNASGSFSYTPTAGGTPFTGTDSFVYRLTDSAGQTATATAQIDVSNHAPWSTGVLLEVHQGATLNAAASQLAAASGDTEAHNLTFALLSSPTHGTLTFSPDGHFDYVPTAGYAGLDSFTWRTNDGIVNGNTSTVTINVANERPNLISNSYRTNSGQQLVVSGNGIRSTASDADGDALTVSVVQTTQHGTLVMAAQGTFTYTPAAGYSGRDTFRARVNDGASNSSDVVFVIDVENALPVATGSNATLRHGTTSTLNMAAYDSDGDSLVYELTTAPAHGTLTYSNLISNGSNGTPIRFTGNVTYTPSATFAGKDELTFRVTDGVGFSEPASISIDVLNSQPTGRQAYHAIDAGASLAVAAPGLLGQALDADGDPMTLQIVTQPSHGTLTLTQSSGTANGGFNYQPAAGFAGVDTFTWRVSDGVAWSDAVTETIAINNSTPVLRDRSFHATYAEGTAVNATTRQYHYDLATLNTAFDLDSDPVTFQIVTNAAHGSATVTAAGAITYTPTSSTFIGQDVFTVRGLDGYSWSEPSKVTITIANEAPLAIGDALTTHHHTTLSFSAADLLGNDYDFDGDTMHIVSVTNGSHGTLTQNGTTWTFNPGSFIGKTSLTYIVSDGLVNSEPATIEIEVTNAPVWGIDRSLTVPENGSIEFEISTAAGNTWSPDGDVVTVSFTAQPAHGTLISLGNSRWRYAPTPGVTTNGPSGIPTTTRGYLGHDTVSFQLSDGILQSAPIKYSFLVIDPRAGADSPFGNNLPLAPGAIPQALLSHQADSGWAPVLDNPLPPVNARYHKLRPGQSASAQINTGGAHVTGLWNGSAWLPVSSAGTTLSTATGSITINSSGAYTATAPVSAGSGKLVTRIRLSAATLSSDSTITMEYFNNAPILASPYASGVGQLRIVDLQTGGVTSSLQPIIGDLMSFAKDVDWDPVTFIAQVVHGGSGDLTINANGTYSYSLNGPLAQSVDEPLEISVSDEFGAVRTATLNLAVGVAQYYTAPIPPANQQHPPTAGGLNGTFLTPGLPIGAVSGASDGGYPALSFEVLGDGKGTYGELIMTGASATYVPFEWQEGAFLKDGQDPTVFKYKVTNGLGEWSIGDAVVKATMIGGGQSVSYGNVEVTSSADDIAVALGVTHGVWTAAIGGVVSNATFTVENSSVYWTGDATTRISLAVHGSVISPIIVSGSAYVLSANGNILQPVIASKVSRVQALNGWYHSVISATDVDWVKSTVWKEGAGAVKAEGKIGYVEWSASNSSSTNLRTWTAPIAAGGSVNTIRVSGHLASQVTAGANLGGVEVFGDILGTMSAGQRIGGGAEYDYFSGNPNPPGYATPLGVTSTNGNVSNVIVAGTNIVFVQSITGSVTAFVMSATGYIGRVEAYAGQVDSTVVATLGFINRVSGFTGVSGSILAATMIGLVWSNVDITASIQSGIDIGSVLAMGNVTGSVGALTGTINTVSAGSPSPTNLPSIGGSVTSTAIRAGKSIGKIKAIHIPGPSVGTWIGGDIIIPGGITTGLGYIHTIDASRSMASTITAGDNIISVSAGTFVNGAITSKNGSILTVSAGTGRIEGEIKADKNVGTVTAWTDRLGKTTSTAGSIGNITATTGKIDGEINGFMGIGNITAGTSILKSITAAGAGASVGKIRAGAHTAGSISGAISVNGNIQSVIATAVKQDQLPTGSTAVPVVVAMPTGGKPPRQSVVWPVIYAGGDIIGGVLAGGGIFDVVAHGRISKYVNAGAELPKVLGYKGISADITVGKGATSVTTYGEFRGDLTGSGSANVWAYGDISGSIEITDGGLNVTTWASFLSSGMAKSKLDAKVWAYNDVVGSLVESTVGTASATGLDSVNSVIKGMLNAIATSGGSLAGSLDAQTRDGFLSAAQNSSMSMTTGKNAALAIGGQLEAEIKSGGATKAVVKSIVGSRFLIDTDNTYVGSGFILVKDDVTNANINSLFGSLYLEARHVINSTISAVHRTGVLFSGGAVAINAYGNVTNTTVNAEKLAAIYASGVINNTKATSAHGVVGIAGIRGVQGEFKALDPTPGAGDISVTSWNGITGTITSLTGNLRTQSYGDQNATVTAGLNSTISVWGNLSGEITSGSTRILARNDVSSKITTTGEFAGFVEVIAGGNITGAVTTNLTVDGGLNHNRYVTLRALGDVTGGAKATEQVSIFGNNVSDEYKSLVKGVRVTAAGSMTGKARGIDDVVVFAGQNISSGGGAASVPPIADQNAAFVSKNGSVFLAAVGELTGVGAFAGASFAGVAGSGVSSTSAAAHGSSSITSFGAISQSSLTTSAGDVSAFAGESGNLTLTTQNGNVGVVTIGDLAGTFAGSGEVTVTSFGSANGVLASGDSVHLFGRLHADGTLTGGSAASIESTGNVSGSLDASVSVVLAGQNSSATVDSGKRSIVVAGNTVSGTVKSKGTASAISASRGFVTGGVSAIVEGRQEASSISLGGSVTGTVKSVEGTAYAFAGQNISSTVEGKTESTAIAIHSISDGEIKAAGPVKAIAFNNVSSSVESTAGYALVIAGDNVSGAVKARTNAIVAAVSGTVSGRVESTGASALVVGMDGVSGVITAHRHAIALSLGSISEAVTATNGSALVASLAGGISGEVKAPAGYAVVIAFDSVSKPVTAGKSVLVVSLANVTGLVDAGEYAIVLAAGGVTGSSVTAGKSALVASLGNVTSSVTAEDGSVLIITLGNVNTSASATEIVAVVALGDIEINVPLSQDLIVISGGDTKYKYIPPVGTGTAASASSNAPGASASRDFVMVGTGSVKGRVNSGRDAVLVTMGSSSASVTAGRDAVLYAFDGIQRSDENHIPTLTGGGDAILISGAGAVANIVGGKNAILVSFDAVSDSTVTAGEFAAIMTLGGGNNVSVAGVEGALAWTYGNFTGSVTSSAGSAVVASIGSVSNTIIHGKENALAVTVGSFSGTVTADDEYAGIISLLNATGTLHAGKGAVILSDGSVNLTATADEDLFIWARGDVHGSYSAGRDAAVVSHGNYDASLTADNDIVFAYAGTSLHGSITAGRWIGSGNTSVPMDPTEIDDVFSHGDIMAQLLAGTSASTDSSKGRIGTIGSIGNAGGTYSGTSIGRIRTSGVVTASYTTTAATGTPVIQENQTTLINNVPRPVLDPSDRAAIVADAAADRAAGEADRLEAIVQLNLSEVALQILRQAILNEVAALRTEIRETADATQVNVDQAVDGAQWSSEAGITVARLLIEVVYRLREAGYLQEQRNWEQFRDTARKILSDATLEWTSLRAQALAAFTKADGDFQRQQLQIFASEAAHYQLHVQKWETAYAKLRQEIADRNATAAEVVDGLHLVLDFAGFLPGVGAVPDIINAMIYAGQGRPGEAGFSLAAAIPIFGDFAKAGKMLAKGASKLDEAAAIASAAAKKADNAADEIIDAGKKGGDELLEHVDEGAASADEVVDESLDLLPYEEGLGHHIPAKSAFDNVPGFDADKVLAVPKAVLEKLNIKHPLVSGAQNRLYTAFGKTGKDLTWEIMEEIETKALTAGGANPATALATVKKAIAALKAAGITGAGRIPWSK